MKNKLTNIIKRKWSTVVLLCAMLAAGDVAWANYYMSGDSNLGLNSDNFSKDLGSSSPYSGTFTTKGTSGWCKIFYDNSDAGHLLKVNNCSNITTGTYSFSKSGGCQFNITGLTANTTYTITINTSTNQLTIATATTSYTISTSGSNCTFSPTSRSIASGSSNTFTVTPASGYKLVSASVTNATCSPTDLDNATSATTITVSNPTGAGTLTVTTAPIASVPTVRIGNEIQEESNYDVTVSAYVAATGCAEINKFTVYYSKSTITSKSGSGVFSKEISASAPEIRSLTDLTLTASEIASHSWGNEDMYVRITATNDEGESELSDEVKLAYTLCSGIITELAISPEGGSVEINKAQTFSYTANTGAVVNSVKWYKNNTEVGTSSTYTFTPTTTSDFTIGLKAYNTTCNPGGFDADTQEYTVCSPVTGVSITNCPATDQTIGTAVTLNAAITGATSASSWVWRVNDAAQEVSVDGATASITFTPREAKEYECVLTVTDCIGVEHTATCTFDATSQFTSNDIEGLEFNACDGGHQFKFSDMFKPDADTWGAVVTSTSDDATSDFTLTDDGYMIWKNTGKTPGSYSYTFTANKSGYTSATALLTFTYTATAPTATLSDITITSGSSPTYPYVKIDLECSVVSGSANDIGWSVDNNGLVVSTSTGHAYFKGKAVKTATTYTISAVGLSATCGATDAKTIEIVVNPEPAEVCTAN